MKIEKNKRQFFIALIIGAVAFFFSSGNFNIFFTAWIWPAAFLFCVRNGGFKRSNLILFGVMFVTGALKWLGLTDCGVLLDFIFNLFVLLVPALSLFIEQKICKAGDELWKSPFGIFIFPSVFTALAFFATLTPIGTMGALANTQGCFHPIASLTSVIGFFGLTFLMTWFASLAERWVSAILDGHKDARPVKNTYAYLTAVVVIAAVCAVSSLTQPTNESNTVRMALAVGAQLEKYDDGTYEELSLEDDMARFDKTVADAKATGAEITVFNEESYTVFAGMEEAAFVAHASEKAEETGMYILVPLEIDPETEDGLYGNRMYLIAPDGDIIAQYNKCHLVPLIEAGFQSGDKAPLSADLQFSGGRTVSIASGICFDSDYPLYFDKIDPDTDVLLVPSWDWKALENYHSYSVTLRSIEHGAALLKPTYDGLCNVTDCRGNWLSCFNSLETGGDHVEATDVPVDGIKTPYAAVLYVFDYVYPVLPLFFIAELLLRKRKAKLTEAE